MLRIPYFKKQWFKVGCHGFLKKCHGLFFKKINASLCTTMYLSKERKKKPCLPQISCKQNASLHCAVHKTVDPPFKNALCYYRVAEGQWVESTSETGAKAKKC